MTRAQLGAIFIVATLLSFGAISYFAATLGQRLRGSAKAQQWMNRAAGTVFASLEACVESAVRGEVWRDAGQWLADA